MGKSSWDGTNVCVVRNGGRRRAVIGGAERVPFESEESSAPG